ncbi:MAG: hypothetical protein LH609_16575 [Rudanella sp.]|nr:hypothetical protein [Rudanella sp.]
MRNYYALFSCGTIASVDMRWLLFLLVGLLPTLVQAQVSGTVFRGVNSNGSKDNSATFAEVGPSGVVIKATNPAGAALILTISCCISRTYNN